MQNKAPQNKYKYYRKPYVTLVNEKLLVFLCIRRIERRKRIEERTKKK